MVLPEGRIKDDFSTGPVSQVPIKWYNRVGGFINGIIGGFGINIAAKGMGETVFEIEPSAIYTPEDGDPAPKDGSDIATDAAGYNTGLAKPLNPDTVIAAITEAGLNTSWHAGEVYDEDTEGGKHKEGKPRGLKLTVCTGVFKIPNSNRYAMLFTDLQFDEHGRLIKAEMAKNCFVYQ